MESDSINTVGVELAIRRRRKHVHFSVELLFVSEELWFTQAYSTDNWQGVQGQMCTFQSLKTAVYAYQRFHSPLWCAN